MIAPWLYLAINVLGAVVVGWAWYAIGRMRGRRTGRLEALAEMRTYLQSQEAQLVLAVRLEHERAQQHTVN